MGKSYRVQIIVAVVGLIGVLGAALIANWDKLFPKPPDNTANKSEKSKDEPPADKPLKPTPVTNENGRPKDGVLVDDSDPRVRYNEGGGWKTDPDPRLLRSTQHYTSNSGSTAALDFNGDWIEVDYYKEPGGAVMDVDIDGKFMKAIDCGSLTGKTEFKKTQVFENLGKDRHVITLKHPGDPNDGRAPRKFGDYTINVDGFRISAADN